MADENRTSELAQAIQEVSNRASLLVHEEIELAKAEMTDKVTKLIRGAVVGIVAGIFAVAALIYLLHAASWAIWELLGTDTNFWVGFLIVGGVLFLLGGLAGYLAARSLKRGTPPKPELAIEEGRLIKETLTDPHAGKPQRTPVRAETGP